ncbi:MAG TPA: succinylglutamate desuccinylase/aspartoacylase family protein [Streptosporangiaceae bacterium]|nr:succinylglutamate desuccinylase/aspartoacylase family protein [Streptosporangiaceae bacterium]
MTDATSYSVGAVRAQAGTQARGYCAVDVGGGELSLPVVVTHGSEPGPVLAVTAGIHGGEYVPVVAVRQFVRDLDPTRMRGTIVACLLSSPAAFFQRLAFVNPLDGQNLNRSFPGDPQGEPTARLAAWLRENLLARADYYVDCHCGDLPEVLDPFAGVYPGPDGTVSDRCQAMADCFDVSRIIVSRLQGDTIAAAAAAGVPAVLVEVGGQGRWSQAEADIQSDGLRRVAELAGILPGEAARSRGASARRRLPLFEDAADVLCERPGLWFPEIAVGAAVAQGSRLGRLEDALGAEVQEILAPVDGVLVYGLGSLAAKQGDLLAFLARPLPGS